MSKRVYPRSRGGSVVSRRVAMALAVCLTPIVTALVSSSPASATSYTPVCGAKIWSSVTLTSNMNCSGYTGGNPILTVEGGGVTLNLNGHTITGPDDNTDSPYGVAVSSSGKSLKNVTVENGTITGFDATSSYGVYVYAAQQLSLSNLTMPASGVYGGVYDENTNGGTISGLTIKSSTYGIYTYGDNGVTVKNSTLTGTGDGFYDEYGTGDVFTNDKAHNISSTSDAGFIEYYDGSVTYTDDTANYNYYGFYVDCDTDGTATLSDNMAAHNTSYGYYTEYCSGPPSGNNGVEDVTANTAKDNGSYGFYDYGFYGGQPGQNAVWSNNLSEYNTTYGFYFLYTSQYIITGNTAENNTGDGMYIADNDSGYNAETASSNSADNNTSYGLYAVYAIPGSGNEASGNAAGKNCFNFVC